MLLQARSRLTSGMTGTLLDFHLGRGTGYAPPNVPDFGD